MTEQLSVAIYVSNPKDIYSGGRYHALMLGEAMVASGHAVYYVTNQLPIFWEDFKAFPDHNKINVICGIEAAAKQLPSKLEYIFVVPGTTNPRLYDYALKTALDRKSRVVLINFESENWFNKYAPKKKPAEAWAQWKRVAAASSVILSIAEEGEIYGRVFYKVIPPNCLQTYVYPTINTIAADKMAHVEREKRILLLARFSGDVHKGGNSILNIIGEHMRNYTLSILVGTGNVPDNVRGELEVVCKTHGVILDWQYKLSDEDKFALYYKSELLLFPSYFEGYGYPPIEARYCGCRVVAFDLPVLRETCGDDIVYVEHGNVPAFKEAVIANLPAGKPVTGYKLDKTVPLSAMSKKLNQVLKQGMEKPADHTLFKQTYGVPYVGDCNPADHTTREKRIIDICRALRRKYKKTRGSITYFPKFRTQADLTNHYYRAAWYFPQHESLIDAVNIFTTDDLAGPKPAPDHFFDNSANQNHIKIQKGGLGYLKNLILSDVVMLWDSEVNNFWRRLILALGIPIVPVETTNIGVKEYGEYPGVIWRHLLTPAEKDEIISESYSNFLRLADKVKKRNVKYSVAFGTGPSLATASLYDFSDGFNVICNSTVQNRKLLDHLDPMVVTAGDVVSHFGVSTYAAQFREDLVKALEERENLFFFGTATFGCLMKYHYPELADRFIFIEQTHDLPNFDLLTQFAAPKLDSTMNIHMLPLAATFSDEIFVLGCDGKSPDEDNEDFWGHAKGGQYHDLVDTGHLCHPCFDIHRQHATYSRYMNSVQSTLEIGERDIGKRYTSLQRSYIPAYEKRQLSLEWYAKKIPSDQLPMSVKHISRLIGIRKAQGPALYCDESLETKLSISSCKVSDGVLRFKGWVLSPYRHMTVSYHFDYGEKRVVFKRVKRVDLKNKFPEYNQEHVGIEFSTKVSAQAKSISLLVEHDGTVLKHMTAKLQVNVDIN